LVDGKIDNDTTSNNNIKSTTLKYMVIACNTTASLGASIGTRTDKFIQYSTDGSLCVGINGKDIHTIEKSKLSIMQHTH
jgi:hypothetical protein